jgi:hypothetical protein
MTRRNAKTLLRWASTLTDEQLLELGAYLICLAVKPSRMAALERYLFTESRARLSESSQKIDPE